MMTINKQLVIALTSLMLLPGGERICAQFNDRPDQPNWSDWTEGANPRRAPQPPAERESAGPLQKLGEFRDRLTEKLGHSAGQGRIDAESDKRLRRASESMSPPQSFPRRREFRPARPEMDELYPTQVNQIHDRAVPRSDDEFQSNRHRFANEQASPVQQARFQQQISESNSLRDRQPELQSVTEYPPNDYSQLDPRLRDQPRPEQNQGYPSLGPNNGRNYGSSSNFSPGAVDNFSPGAVDNFGGGSGAEFQGDYSGLPSQPYDPRFQHFSSRMPASERLLQLEQEMAEVLLENRSLQANNAMLQAELNENRKLMLEVNQSIDQAVTQLKSAEQTNKNLRDQLAQLDREKRRQEEESSRLLDDIRQQLNELLAKEISSAGK